jgi:hypothetical protein
MVTKKQITDDWQLFFSELRKVKLLELDKC